MEQNLRELLESAINTRKEWLSDDDHYQAIRLFNGYTEGAPGLTVDLYASSLLIHDLGKPAGQWQDDLVMMSDLYCQRIPWLDTIILKTRHTSSQKEKIGRLLYGNNPAEKIREHGVWYALDLLMGQDAGFYLDTANLRKWLIENLEGRTVLNTFAYTGSLGVAALAGGADKVTQSDRNPGYLKMAEKSSQLNEFDPLRSETLAGDFYRIVSQLKREGKLFDCVILDPPFFSAGERSSLDLQKDSTRLINKLRPLVADNGWLIAINNALFLKGKDYMSELEALCADGYLKMEEFIPVPEDFIGAGADLKVTNPADPSPFNHPTKIAILKVRRKDKEKRLDH